MKWVEDQRILQQLKDGDQRTFKNVYEAHRDRFIHFARRYQISDDDIIDIYQDVYIALYENIKNKRLVELKSTLSTYLHSVGKYMIRDFLRKNNRRNDYKSLENTPSEAEDIAHFDLDTDQPTEQQQLMYRHFKALGEACQKLLTLFYLRGLNLEEIMQVGGYNSINVVKSSKSRCLKDLKQRIAENR